MIKAIVFDCFGVLTADLWREFVAQLPDEQKEPARRLNQQLGSAQISAKQFMNLVEHLTGQRPPDMESASADQPKNTELMGYIRELKEKYKIGVLSNASSHWLKDNFLTKEEERLFDSFTLSFEEKTTKPDPKIYQSAARQLGVELDEIIYVDDVEGYVLAARQLGIKGILYQNFKQMKRDIEAILSQH